MKKILWLCLGVLVGSANANASSSEDQEEKCLNAMAMAKAAMSIRQQGLPLSDALKNIQQSHQNGDMSKKEYDLIKMILRDAYSKPKFLTKEYQDESINEYSAKYYLACMEVFDPLN